MSRSSSPTSSLNIYTAIEENRRKTALFIAAFVLLIGLIAFAVGIVLGLPVAPAGVVSLVLTAFALLLALWLYRASDRIVLGISEAREAKRQEHLELYRTVENISIAAGIPMPKVYIINDTAPNAFATGRDPAHASVAVTTGLLQKLSKLELEGVIAHEISHIRNFDTRLMVMVAVFVGFIAVLADVMLRYTWYGAGRRTRYKGKGEGSAGAVVLVLAIVALILAPIAAQVIQFAIARQREFLADASSALLTRYPAGLAGALEKITNDTEPLEVATKGTAHLYIANPIKGQESSMNNLFATHPPIKERVARLRAMASAA
ncbi:MAG: M48 family metallopeptidase [Chloroflexi bacterium]|nr:M48 family metallopeptidase [Chloroflexota bacterium]